MAKAMVERMAVMNSGPKVADDCLSANRQAAEAKAMNNERGMYELQR